MSLLGVILYLRVGPVVEAGGLLGAWAGLAVGLGTVTCGAAALATVAANARGRRPGVVGLLVSGLGVESAGTVAAPLWLVAPLRVALHAAAVGVAVSWMVPAAPGPMIGLGVIGVALAVVARWPSAGPWAELGGLVLAAAGLATVLLDTPAGTGRPMVGDPSLALIAGVAAGSGVWSVAWRGGPSTARSHLGAGLLVLALGTVAWLAATGQLSRAAAFGSTALLDRSAIPALVWLGWVGAGLGGAIGALGDGAATVTDLGRRGLLPLGAGMVEGPGAGAVAAIPAALLLGLLDPAGLVSALAAASLLATLALCTVVGIERALGRSAFRPPALTLSLAVPVLGGLGAAAGLVALHPLLGLVGPASLLMIYVGLSRRPGLKAEARSALVASMAQWAGRRIPWNPPPRAWRPSLVVPIPSDGLPPLVPDLLADIAWPDGAATLLGLSSRAAEDQERVAQRVSALGARLADQGVDTSRAMIGVDDPAGAARIAVQALQASPERPNLLLLTVPPTDESDPDLRATIADARRARVGVALVWPRPEGEQLQRRSMTLWVRGVPGAWDPLEGYEGRNLDLALLLGWRLARRWSAELRLVTVVSDPAHRPDAERFLAELAQLARMPLRTQRLVIVGAFEQAVEDLSNSDLDVFGLQPEPDLAFVRRLARRSRSTCLFVLDSGRESALA